MLFITFPCQVKDHYFRLIFQKINLFQPMFKILYIDDISTSTFHARMSAICSYYGHQAVYGGTVYCL